MGSEKGLTDKQRDQVQKRINYYGFHKVKDYIRYFYPNADLRCLSCVEAQKIITGMKLPSPIIKSVYLRDFHTKLP